MRDIKNRSEYQQLVDSGKPVLLDFYADWCGPCKVQLPAVERLSDKYESSFVVAKVNVDKNQELAQQFQVRSIPSLFFVKDGKIQERLTGVQSEASLDAKILAYSN